MKQCIFVVLDSVGIGELPDAASYGDAGADTLGHIASAAGPLVLKNLQAMGLGNITRAQPVAGCGPIASPTGAYGRLAEASVGKDTATGHWEFMGLITDTPFATFPEGFPQEMIDAFCEKIGVDGVLANRPASGTQIIEELGREHLATGKPIVYTSADPVLQIAAHEDLVPIEKLYAWCEAAFELAVPLGLSRVIARPFVGTWPNYTRTHRRRDYAVDPPAPTYLNELQEAGVETMGIGKIPSIYAHSGVSGDVHTKNNNDGIDATLQAMRDDTHPFVFTNLVDFDMLYGHRRNPEGYAACLQNFDRRLPELLDAMGDEDLLILSADHGNDPTFPGTDHTREYVPVMAFGKWARQNVDLGTRTSFADVGRTIMDFFDVPTQNESGTSFLKQMQE